MTDPIRSISGIRGVFNQTVMASDVVQYGENFASLVQGGKVLIGRDTRPTGDVVSRMVCGALLAKGADVIDYGVLSTPALFRESRRRKIAAVMVTASHNEPDWNGMKFIIDGRGVLQPELERIVRFSKSGVEGHSERAGALSRGTQPSYNSELVEMSGEGSGDGVRVVIDANGGAAIKHAPPIFSRLGCRLTTLGGTPGLFSRIIDPTNDDLELLTATVSGSSGDVGFAFDCDGDRLVVVDSEGRKRSGDFMLTLALKELLPRVSNRSVVVSADTTQAVDEVVSDLGGVVHRSKVGEANVISKMMETGARFGGEGSSGGLIDGEFNYCRDSMIAATAIVSALKQKGRGIFKRVRSYSQVRLKLPIERRKAVTAIRKLQRKYPEADSLDGLKIHLSKHTWVLIRPSGTENVVRISAESDSAKEAEVVASSFLNAIRRLGA